MKTPQIILLAVILSAGVSAVTTLTLQKDEVDAGQSAERMAADRDRELMRERLKRMETSQLALAETIESLESNLSAPSESSRVSMSEVEEMVARALAKHAPPGTGAPASVDALAAAEKKLDPVATAKMLLSDELSYDEKQLLWEKIREAGKMEEVVAWFETNAEENPNDPNAQVDLGNAYLQKLMTLPDGPMKGQWAMKADGMFDKALELDDHHWEGRFAKAVSLSFWPPVFGKQQEAINHFETLISQQQNQPAQDGHAQTYLLLGNMYSQMGQIEQAVSTWTNGLGAHPGDSSLQEQIDTFAGNGDN